MRIAIVGLGEAGAGIHLPSLRGLEQVELVGGADVDPERRQAAARWRVPLFADPAQLLADTKPDLVIIASPPRLHAAHCLAALEAGAHVLCEKPFATSVREAEGVLARAGVLGRQVAVNHEFRAMPIFQSVANGIRNEGEGAAVMVQAWQLLDADPAHETGWRGQLHHRTLYEAGVHLVDLVLTLFGETPHAVRATVASGSATAASRDAIVLVTLEFSRGRLAQIVQHRRHRGDRQYLEIRADTPTASYRASFGGRARLSAGLERSTRPTLRVEWGASGVAWREQGARRTMLARNPPSSLVIGTRAVTAACLRALAEGRPVPYPATEGLDGLRVIAAAYLSAELGRTVALHGADAAAAASLPLGTESVG